MPEHEAAPSPAGMLGWMDAGNSGLKTIFLLEQASLQDICCFLVSQRRLSLLSSPPSGAWQAARRVWRSQGDGNVCRRSDPSLQSDPVPVLQHSLSPSDVNEVLRAAKPSPLQRLPGSELKGLSPCICSAVIK